MKDAAQKESDIHMKNLTKTFICSLVLSIMTVSAAMAQNYAVKAKLVDSTTGESVAYATASFIPEGGDKAVKYVLSTDDGSILVDRLKKGSYTIKVEMLGYKNYTRKFKLEGSQINLGNLDFEPDSQMLDAAKVSDVGNPITIKKDTIEYNATIFKQSENDMLIDLLKKLPGIEVGTDGSITANGKEIKKITIDGKTFFLDDPQLATKNIPSKIVEKVKVVDKKSEQALFTGIDDGEEETIIDLGIKKGMMKGWFGNLLAGGGHDVPSSHNTMNDWRYQGAGFIGNFGEHQQISVILNGNNTNNRGFNDLAGSMMGGMRGGGRGGWGSDNGGITTSWMGGVNGAWDLLDNRMELASHYLYNGSSSDAIQSGFKRTEEDANKTLNYTTEDKNHSFTNGHRFGVRLDHKFNKNTSIFFEPQFNFGNGDYFTDETFETVRSFKDGTDSLKLNHGLSHTDGKNDNQTASGQFLLRQRLGKPGRTMTINLRYNFSNNFTKGNVLNQTILDYDDPTNVSEAEDADQRFGQKRVTTSLTAGATYTEPLYREVLFLEANYNYTWSTQNSNKDTYDLIRDDDGKVIGEEWSEKYSNNIHNTSHNHRAGINLMYQKDGLNIQIGVNANPTTTTNRTQNAGTKIDTTYTTVAWSPQVSLRYEVNDNSNLRLNYWGRSNQPSTNQLMPVLDNSNPLAVSLGNPYLLPYFNHNLRGMYRYSNKKSFTSVNVFFNGGMVQSPIVNTSWFENGRQFSLPVNGPNSHNANVRAMVNSPLGKSKIAGMFSIFAMVNAGYSNGSSYVKTGNTLDIFAEGYYHDGRFEYARFQNEVVNTERWNENFSLNRSNTMNLGGNFRLTFRNDLVEVNAGMRERINKTWYSLNTINQNMTFNTTVETSMNWTLPHGIGLNAEYNYNRYDGYATPQKDAHVLNAEITKLLFKNKFTLALKGYDLLGQSRNINVSDGNGVYTERVSNTLGRYLILSLTYRFGTFDMSKMKGGPGGHRGPGGPGGPRR